MTARSKRAGHSSRSQEPATGTNGAVEPDDVARRVYELFEERGCEPGRDLDDWLRAERELKTSEHRTSVRMTLNRRVRLSIRVVRMPGGGSPLARGECQSRTLKYCPPFPERFGSSEDGRAFGQSFFPWYNHEHHHSGLGFLPPAVVHFGQAAAVRAHRGGVLTAAYAAHPERFVNGPPRPADLPTAVWINPPVKKPARQDAPGTTIVLSDDQRVASIHDPDDDLALVMIDPHATLITEPLVSQCH